MKDPEVIRIFENGGSAAAYQDASEFAKFVEGDSARLIAVTRRIGKLVDPV